MQAFDYVAPESIQETIALLEEHKDRSRLLAGGTDLLVQLRERQRFADLVVDIKHVPELNQLSFSEQNGLIIGAAVSCFRIWNNETIIRLYPGLVDAAELIGGIQIQGRATFGGNLANASPAADSIPALIVHTAMCEIAGPNGNRRVPVEQFCTAPGQNILATGELLVALHIKPPATGFGAHYLRFIPRNEMDIAVVGAGASVVLDPAGSTIESARVALGAVAPTPLLVNEIGEYLAGRPVSEEVIQEAGKLATEAATPISDIRGTAAQRKHLAGVLTRRSLEKAIHRARTSLQEGS